MGVSRNQLSNLYQQYRKDFQNNPPQDLMGDTPPTGTTPTQPSLFSGEYQKEGPVKGPSITSTTPAATPTLAPPDSGPAIPSLDRLAESIDRLVAMRGTTGGLAKRGSSTGFSPFGGGTSSAKKMNNIASANLYFAAAGRQRQLKEQEAEERGFNRANGTSDMRVPYF